MPQPDYALGMVCTSRQALATNLQRLMERTPDLDSGPKLAKRAKVAQATVSRVLNQKVGASVDVVDALARAFGVNPWMLMHPNMDIAEAETRLYAAMRREFQKLPE